MLKFHIFTLQAPMGWCYRPDSPLLILSVVFTSFNKDKAWKQTRSGGYFSHVAYIKRQKYNLFSSSFEPSVSAKLPQHLEHMLEQGSKKFSVPLGSVHPQDTNLASSRGSSCIIQSVFTDISFWGLNNPLCPVCGACVSVCGSHCAGVIAELSAWVPRQVVNGKQGYKQRLKTLLISLFILFYKWMSSLGGEWWWNPCLTVPNDLCLPQGTNKNKEKRVFLSNILLVFLWQDPEWGDQRDQNTLHFLPHLWLRFEFFG